MSAPHRSYAASADVGRESVEVDVVKQPAQPMRVSADYEVGRSWPLCPCGQQGTPMARTFGKEELSTRRRE